MAQESHDVSLYCQGHSGRKSELREDATVRHVARCVVICTVKRAERTSRLTALPDRIARTSSGKSRAHWSLSRCKGCAGDLETDRNGSVMIVPFADHIGAVRRVNVSQGVQGTAISTLVELVFWLPNESGPLLLRLFWLLFASPACRGEVGHDRQQSSAKDPAGQLKRR